MTVSRSSWSATTTTRCSRTASPSACSRRGYELSLSDRRTYIRYKFFRGHFDFVTSNGLGIEAVETLQRGSSDHLPILVRAAYQDAVALPDERIRMARIAVVGGGIVGCTTALLLADRGHSVDLFEREAELWSGASQAGRKIHLGPVFALGGPATHEAQLRGALSFSPVFARAIGRSLDWEGLATERFEYLVMPDLTAGSGGTRGGLSPDQRDARRTRAGARARVPPGAGSIAPSTRRSIAIRRLELMRFVTEERAVNPNVLRAAAIGAIAGRPEIAIRTGTPVSAIRTDGDAAQVVTTLGEERFDVVVNCAWAWQEPSRPGCRRGISE